MPRLVLVFVFACSLGYSASPKGPQDCPKGEHWVRPHHRRAYARADGTLVSASNISGHCQKNPASFDHWNPKKKTGLPPGWEFPKDKPGTWTDEEWERVLEALSELPEILWVPTIEGIYRLQKSRFPENPAAGEPKNLALYNPAFNSKDKLAQILAHELAHELYRNLTEAERTSYRDATFWFTPNIRNKIYTIRGRSESQFVAPDGIDSPEEDFSNNVEYYLFSSKKLEAVTPSAYKWIQQRYGDKLKLGSKSKL